MNYLSSITSLSFATIATLALGMSLVQPTVAQIPNSAVRASLNLAQNLNFGSNSVTSVTQFNDVKPNDRYFMGLQSLTERYGIVVAYEDGNFHAEIPLSRGQFVLFLDRGLERIVELGEAASNNKYKYAFKKFSANNLKLTSVAKIKDLAPSSAYYTAVQSLKERYGIDFVDKDGMLQLEKPVTEQELQYWLDGVFSTGKSSNYLRNKNVSRGQFVMKFNETLDLVNTRIAD